jgi:hypothetical protein
MMTKKKATKGLSPERMAALSDMFVEMAQKYMAFHTGEEAHALNGVLINICNRNPVAFLRGEALKSVTKITDAHPPTTRWISRMLVDFFSQLDEDTYERLVYNTVQALSVLDEYPPLSAIPKEIRELCYQSNLSEVLNWHEKSIRWPLGILRFFSAPPTPAQMCRLVVKANRHVILFILLVQNKHRLFQADATVAQPIKPEAESENA